MTKSAGGVLNSIKSGASWKGWSSSWSNRGHRSRRPPVRQCFRAARLLFLDVAEAVCAAWSGTAIPLRASPTKPRKMLRDLKSGCVSSASPRPACQREVRSVQSQQFDSCGGRLVRSALASWERQPPEWPYASRQSGHWRSQVRNLMRSFNSFTAAFPWTLAAGVPAWA